VSVVADWSKNLFFGFLDKAPPGFIPPPVSNFRALLLM